MEQSQRLSSGAAAKRLGISRAGVLRLVREGRVEAAFINASGHHEFDADVIEALLEERIKNPPKRGPKGPRKAKMKSKPKAAKTASAMAAKPRAKSQPKLKRANSIKRKTRERRT